MTKQQWVRLSKWLIKQIAEGVIFGFIVVAMLLGVYAGVKPAESAEYTGYEFETSTMEQYIDNSVKRTNDELEGREQDLLDIGVELLLDSIEPPTYENDSPDRVPPPPLEVTIGGLYDGGSYDLLGFTFANVHTSFYTDDKGNDRVAVGYILRYDVSVFELSAELGCSNTWEFDDINCHAVPTVAYTGYFLQPVVSYHMDTITIGIRGRFF